MSTHQHSKTKRFFYIVLFISICLLTGYISHIFQAEALITWYPTLLMSELTPPTSVFPIVWLFLFLLMGISAGIAYTTPSTQKRSVMALFVVQLIMNILWSFGFFFLQSPLTGLIILLVLDFSALFYFIGSMMIRYICGWLVFPYILWLIFATYLNGYIYVFS